MLLLLRVAFSLLDAVVVIVVLVIMNPLKIDKVKLIFIFMEKFFCGGVKD